MSALRMPLRSNCSADEDEDDDNDDDSDEDLTQQPTLWMMETTMKQQWQWRNDDRNDNKFDDNDAHDKRQQQRQ